MKKVWFFVGLIVCLLALTVPASLKGPQRPSAAHAAALTPPTAQIIIQFEDAGVEAALLATTEQSDLPQLSQAAGMLVSYVREMSGDAHVVRLPQALSPDDVAAIAAQLETVEGVVYAEPDRIKTIDGRPIRPLFNPNLTPNDTQFGSQWHYMYTPGSAEGLNLVNAWNISTGSASTVVAVLDTGILNHNDLAGKTVPGYDFIADPFVGNDGNGRDSNPADPGDWYAANECGGTHAPSDSSWHGTHVAGTIGAATNNNLGVAGVNWHAKILPVRVLGKCGGYTSDIVDGMRWAAGLAVAGVPANANPAKVLNLSLGGPGACSATEQNAINAIVAAGSTVVVAAGNADANAAGFSPANCNNVITVAATNRTGSRAFYSNYGSVVEVSAPGGETDIFQSDGVLSTLDSGATVPANSHTYEYYQGTSMAAPHVAGLASLIVGRQPGYTPQQVLTLLQDTARNFPGGSTCSTSNCGAGIVDAYGALNSFGGYLIGVLYINYGSPPPTDPIINPGFESGPTGWTESATNPRNLIINSGFPSGVTPHGGSWATRLGGAHLDTSYIQQQVTVPAGTPYLAYWHWIDSEDFCGWDYGSVLINGAVVHEYDLCSAENTNGWVQKTVNLSAYAGQSVQLRIRAVTDSSLNSNLFVDDVSFQAGPAPDIGPASGAVPANDPAAARQPAVP